jgi:hypothetical protein
MVKATFATGDSDETHLRETVRVVKDATICEREAPNWHQRGRVDLKHRGSHARVRGRAALLFGRCVSGACVRSLTGVVTALSGIFPAT